MVSACNHNSVRSGRADVTTYFSKLHDCRYKYRILTIQWKWKTCHKKDLKSRAQCRHNILLIYVHFYDFAKALWRHKCYRSMKGKVLIRKRCPTKHILSGGKKSELPDIRFSMDHDQMETNTRNTNIKTQKRRWRFPFTRMFLWQ